MQSRHSNIHSFKQQHFKDTHNMFVEADKYSHILYKMVPNILFTTDNKLTKLFTNGIAIVVAKTVSLLSYAEYYFDISDTHNKQSHNTNNSK